MEEMLENAGFEKVENEDTWEKDTWTVRFFGDDMEVFNTPIDDEVGKYLRDKKDEADLEAILYYIDFFTSDHSS
jgi:hypothetical protein